MTTMNNEELDECLLDDAKYGFGSHMRFLLKNGANPNVTDKDGNTPAHIAAKNGHFFILADLEEYNADFSIKNNDGKTPGDLATRKATEFFNNKIRYDNLSGQRLLDRLLLDVIQHSNEELSIGSLDEWLQTIIEEALSIGANPNCKDEITGDTPAHLAAKDGNFEALCLLSRCGASFLETNKEGKTPIDLIVDYLKQKEKFKGKPCIFNKQKSLDSILEYAIWNKLGWIENLALKAGANPNVNLDSKGYTPAHVASEISFLEGLEILDSYGADFSLKNEQGLTPEDMSGDETISDFFNDLKQNTNKQQTNHETILHDKGNR